MTNLELAVAILAKHREARRWADEAVAVDMLAQFGVDPAGIEADQQHANEPETAVAVAEIALNASHG